MESNVREALLTLWENGDEDDRTHVLRHAELDGDEILLQALERRK